MQMKLPRQHIQAYHLDHSLLFQFILYEILNATNETKHLECSDITALEDQIEAITCCLIKLCGPQLEFMHLFAWSPADGILAKLQMYCGYYIQTSPSPAYSAVSMYNQSHKLWMLCLRCTDTLRLYQESSADQFLAEALFQNLQKLLRCMHNIGKMAIKTLSHYRNDENVIYFLLRHTIKFDEAFGKSFTWKFLMKSFPEGLPGVEAFLSEKYHRRGFEALIPTISSKIAELADV